MKKITFLSLGLILALNLKSQFFTDERKFHLSLYLYNASVKSSSEIFTTNMLTSLPEFEYANYFNVNVDGYTVAYDPFSLNWYFRSIAIGDLFYEIFKLMTELGVSESDRVIEPWFTSIFENSFPVNLVTTNNFAFSIGPNINWFAIEVPYKRGATEYEKHTSIPVTIGPSAMFEINLGDKVLLRNYGCINYQITNFKKDVKQSPIYNFNTRLIFKFGLFLGYEFFKMPPVNVPYTDEDIDVKRRDFSIGYMWFLD